MGIVKVVALGIVIWLVWFIVKRLCAVQQQRIVQESVRSAPVKSMKQCLFCGVHVLEDEAFSESGSFFCSKSHHDKYYSK